MTEKSTSSHRSPKCSAPEKHGEKRGPADDPLQQDDELWSLLGHASKKQADPFFARNVMRAARQLEEKPESWLGRLTGFITPGRSLLTAGAAACLGLLVITQIDHQSPPVESPTGDSMVAAPEPESPSSNDFAELVIEQSLMAAAEDPSQFTHDELVTIVGL